MQDPADPRPSPPLCNTEAPTGRRRWLQRAGALGLAPLLPTTLLAGCGGSDDDDDGSGIARLRAINRMSDVASADLFIDDRRVFAALSSDSLREAIEMAANDYTAKIKRAGESSTLLSGTYSFASDQHYTAVLWGRESAPRLSTLPEDENDGDDDFDAGDTRVRMLAATQDGGSLDVYLTSESAILADSTARLGGVSSGQLTGFAELSAGTWRLRVTGAGDVADLRLDVSGLVLPARKHHTLVLTPSAGGVLVDGLLLPQQARETQLPNRQARVRIVASCDAAATVTVSRGGRTLASGLRSPSVGPCQMVEAGTAPFVVRVSGAVVESATAALVAGTDCTLLVLGTGQVRLLTDDNRLPSNSSRLKLRLVHGVAGLDALSLSVSYLVVATDVAAGSGSDDVVTTSSFGAQLDVTAPSVLLPVYTDDEVTLSANAVYTVFVLAGNAGGATGVIRKER